MTKTQVTTANDMGDRELQDWDRIAPLGREFGSPDYEHLEELDHLPVFAKRSVLAARRWLDTPDLTLDSMTPEEVAKTPRALRGCASC